MVKNQATREVAAGVLQVAPTPGRCVSSCCVMPTVAWNSQAREENRVAFRSSKKSVEKNRNSGFSNNNLALKHFFNQFLLKDIINKWI